MSTSSPEQLSSVQSQSNIRFRKLGSNTVKTADSFFEEYKSEAPKRISTPAELAREDALSAIAFEKLGIFRPEAASDPELLWV